MSTSNRISPEMSLSKAQSNRTSRTMSPSNVQSNRTSQALSASNAQSTRESEVTLTPGTDGASDYQQYLEKTSNPRASSFLTSPPPTANTDAGRRNHSILSSRPQTGITELQQATSRSAFEPIRSEKKRKRRPHRVERAEDPHEYPAPLALSLLTIGICLSVFLVSLDRTIVATVGNLDQNTRPQS